MYGFKTLPTLGKYSHNAPTDGMCVMELVSYINGEEFSDTPQCTEINIASIAQEINDRLDDSDRHLILQEFDRLFGTSDLEIPAYQQEWFDALHALVEELLEEYKDHFVNNGWFSPSMLDHGQYKDDLPRSIRHQIMLIRAVLRRYDFLTPKGMMSILSRLLDAADKVLGRETVELVDRDLVDEKLRSLKPQEAQ